MYKHYLESDKDKACEHFLRTQKRFEKTSSAIMYFAYLGGMIFLVIINSAFGEAVSALCAIIGMSWYVLGYQYCQALWSKEKDSADFYKALEEYDKHNATGR